MDRDERLYRHLHTKNIERKAKPKFCEEIIRLVRRCMITPYCVSSACLTHDHFLDLEFIVQVIAYSIDDAKFIPRALFLGEMRNISPVSFEL